MAAPKLKKPPIPMHWRQTGMKPGVRVPGTTSWMREWRENPESQKRMAAFAREVEQEAKTMSSMKVTKILEKYLSGDWSPEDEVEIAAAIRRSPVWETKYNQMMEDVMKEEKTKKTAKSRKRAADTSLAERIGQVEDDVEEMRKALHLLLEQVGALQRGAGKTEEERPRKKRRASKEERDHRPAKEAPNEEIQDLLEALDEAKEKGDSAGARKIRIKLRRLGYSLRSNGK